MSTPDTPPSEQELTRYVIDKLAAFATRNDVVFDVCRVMDWEWDRAELFVKAVQERNFRRIAFGQSPWILFLGVGVLILGLGLTMGMFILLWDAYRGELLSNPALVLRAPRLVYAFFVGVTMIVGSLGGLWIFMSQVIRGR